MRQAFLPGSKRITTANVCIGLAQARNHPLRTSPASGPTVPRFFCGRQECGGNSRLDGGLLPFCRHYGGVGVVSLGCRRGRVEVCGKKFFWGFELEFRVCGANGFSRATRARLARRARILLEATRSSTTTSAEIYLYGANESHDESACPVTGGV